MTVSFVVPGPAVPERKRQFGRHRCDTREAADYKTLLRYHAGIAMAGRPPLEGPLALTLTVVRVRPKSLPKRVTYPITRPDLSNQLKLVEDAFNKVLWGDDAQLVEILVTKGFGDAEGIGVTVEIIGAPAPEEDHDAHDH